MITKSQESEAPTAPPRGEGLPLQRSARRRADGGRHDRRRDAPEVPRPGTARSAPGAADLMGDVLREVALVREQVTASTSLYGAYRDAAHERAQRISELMAQAAAHEHALAEARLREEAARARIHELEATVTRVVGLKRAAEARVEEVKQASRAETERARRAESSLRAERASHARTRAQRSSLLARRSVRLCRWVLDRPVMRRVVRVLTTTGPGRA